MTLPETADAINRDAADWATRADRGLTEAETSELAAWLAADPRRAGAYMRMTAVLVATEVVTEIENAPEAVSRARRPLTSGATRRWWLAGAAAAAAAVGVGLHGGLGQSRTFETRKGEKRVIALKDGSLVTLDTASRLEVRYAQDLRQVRLMEGQALFDVAPDAARPFIVSAAGLDVRAVGTSFTVTTSERHTVKVLVSEGVVEVLGPKTPPLRLEMNTRATIGGAAAPLVAAVSPAEVVRELAWREGRLMFAGESLSDAVAEFARYSDNRIVVSDPALAHSAVAGVFDANDPVGFARAVATSLESRAEVREGHVLITR